MALAARAGIAVAAFGVACFFAWWAAVIWGNIWDRGADNTGTAYFAVGLVPAVLAGLALSAMLASLRGRLRWATGFLWAVVAVVFVLLRAGFFG